MFAAALEDEETCRLVLECILGASVGRVRVKAERSVLLSADFREIIFICNFDPFGRGLYRYTFEPCCLEADFPLEDGTKRIFLSTKGTNEEDVSGELLSFLRYVTDSTDACIERTKEEKLGKIHKRVKALKQDRELEEKYMNIGEWLQIEHRQAYKEAYEEAYEKAYKEIYGEACEKAYKEAYEKAYEKAYKEVYEKTMVQIWELIARMTADGKAEQVSLLKEEAFYQEMVKEYCL